MSAYEIVWFHGHRFDRMTVQALLDMEHKLGYQLTILQGSYNGGAGKVAASAGTHNGGGAVDLAPADAHDKVRAGREVGFAMWERQTLPGVWSHHVHGILIGNAKVSSGAAHQITDYRNHRNGLAGHAADNTWHPSPIRGYRYHTAPTVAVDLSNLRIDFINAAHDHGGNAPAARVRNVQRQLASKGIDCYVDGIVGPQTLGAWKKWERKNGDSTPNNIPDEVQLKALLKGSKYYMVP